MLIVAGTPIGRAEDASARLRAVLRDADVIAAEDTRRLRRLAADLGVELSARVVSYFEGNEERRTEELVRDLTEGRTVVLVTDAGMPSVSDPGYRLVDAAVAADVAVTAVPGPSAVLTALAVSGLAVDRFCFDGFVPRKSGERAAFLGGLVGERRTVVVFESPHRTIATLREMVAAFGPDRPVAVCRELTKTYEEVRRGTTSEVLAWAEGLERGVRGEITIVIAGATPVERDYSAAELKALVAGAEADGLSRRDAIARVVAETGVRKREVYDAAHT